MRKFIWLLAFGLWTALIFYNSSLPGTQSHQASWWLADVAEQLGSIFAGFPPAEVLERALRKLAHFFEYFCQGLLACRLFGVYGWARRASHGYILLAGLLTAVCDEYLQAVVPGRNGAIADILLDFVGTMTAWGTWQITHWKR